MNGLFRVILSSSVNRLYFSRNALQKISKNSRTILLVYCMSFRILLIVSSAGMISGARIGVPVYFFVRGSGNLLLAAISMIAVMLPFFFMRMYEKNGQLPEPVAGKKSGTEKLALLLPALAAIGGGGGWCYLQVRNKKREAEENKPDPDADYAEDEIVLPNAEPDEETDEAERKAYQSSDGYEDE